MSPTRFLALTLPLLAVVSSCQCQRRTVVDTPIPELEPCESDERCETGLCDSASPNDPKVCLRKCTAGCRGSDVCSQLPGERFACVPERAGLCSSCTQDSDCPYPADRCIVLGDERFCGRDCSYDEACPPSFRCAEANTVSGERVLRQCQPSSGTCTCTSASSGQQIPCEVTNALGRCVGARTCEPPQGFGECSARTPAAEVCNSIDDDCDGLIDEDLGDSTCGMGECVRSISACLSGVPQNCVPGTPSTEVCNGRDDDCDGTVDDGFDTQTNVNHCGTCNSVCALTNAVPGCELGRCTVSRCTPGWTDLDRIAANGCEYPCTPTADGGLETCDGLDNDCNGIVDDGFNLVTDPLNCGQCGLQCALPSGNVSTYACVARVCSIGSCVAGRGNCNQQYGDGCEVNTQADVLHCGSCGNACTVANGAPACDAGSCGIASCTTGFADCNRVVTDGCEVDTRSTVAHCGACNRACSARNATSSCVNSGCTFVCNSGYFDADGQAANGCEYQCQLTAGGTEACDGIDNDCDARTDEDFDTTTDARHCGACNRACTAPFASTVCAASTCSISTCQSNRGNCNNQYVDGCEVDLTSTLAHCGACNRACAPANATGQCASSTCSISSCNTGFRDCNASVTDGCEVNINTSLAHCGGCNQLCSPAHATGVCTGGGCGIASRQAGYVNLNGSAADGCEYQCTVSNGGTERCDNADNDCDGQTDEGFDKSTDVNNCGTCGTVCAATQVAAARCTAGACQVVACNAGFGNCNTTFTDGCEVNTTNTVTHCSACGASCSLANATAACSASTCQVASCNAGFGNCNGNPADGCETNTNTTVAHCGACARPCAPANATAACTGGSCQVGSCNTGFRDCNSNPTDGCEVNVTNTVAHCGGCGQVCNPANAVPQCVSGGCGIASCNAGYVNLNGSVADGCEYACTVSNGGTELCDNADNDCDGQTDEGFDKSTDENNCGSCGTVCSLANASPICLGGACQVQACFGTFGNCNGLSSDGCEVNTQNNPAACGSCANVCPVRANASRTCSGTTCGFTCNGGYVDLNGQASDGCECFGSGSDLPDLSGVDLNCDGVDGDASTAIFVATTGSDGNPGTRAAPKRTITAGIGTAASQGKVAVFVGEGTYVEEVALQSGIGVYGGYRPSAGWTRPADAVTTISSPTRLGVIGRSLSGALELQRLVIRSQDASGTLAGGEGLSSVALVLDSAGSVTLRAAELRPGRGAAGLSGSNGAPGTNGGGGSAASGSSPGAGGFSACGAHGGTGGLGVSGQTNGNVGGDGTQAPGGGAASSGSGGGLGKGCDSSNGNGTAGLPVLPSPADNGFDGAHAGSPTALGSVGALAEYVASSGAPGASGTPGGGAGGGGSGGGTRRNRGTFCDTCDQVTTSGGGGGGGAGGCGGAGGSGGKGGGGSFGLLSVSTVVFVVDGTTVVAAAGGTGGNGAVGGSGGGGGGVGTGGTGTQITGGCATRRAGDGASGGVGGTGGTGGSGAGGPGGPSVCVAYQGTAPSLPGLSCITTGGGAGGTGGTGAASGPTGVATTTISL